MTFGFQFNPFYNMGNINMMTMGTFDMIGAGTNPMCGLNLLFNQCQADIQARQGFMQTSAMMSNTMFNAYNSGFTQLPPIQMPEGQSLFDKLLSNFRFPTMQYSPFMNPSMSPSNTLNNEKDPDVRKYKKAEAIISSLTSSTSNLSQADKDKLNAAIEEAKALTGDENKAKRTEIVQKALKEIGQDKIINALKNYEGQPLIKGMDGKEVTIKKALADAGYEIENTELTKDINELHEQIAALRGSKNGSISQKVKILGNFTTDGAVGNYTILAIVSNWKHKYKTEQNLIGFIANNIDKMADKDAKKEAVKATIIPLTNALIRTAENCKVGLPTDKADELQTLINKATTEVTALADDKGNIKDEAITTTAMNKVATAFDELYLATRMAAMAKVGKGLEDSLGEVQGEIFTKGAFDKQTTNALKTEGYSDAKIKKAAVVMKSEDKNLTPEQVEAQQKKEKQAAINKAKNIMNKKHNGITCKPALPYNLAVLKKKFPDENIVAAYFTQPNNKSCYIIDGDGNIKLIKGVEFSYTKDKKITDTTDFSNVELETQSEEDLNTNMRDEEPDTEVHDIKYEISDEKKYKSAQYGIWLQDTLCGFTSSSERDGVSKVIKNKVNKQNILYVLKAYHNEASCSGDFFEQFLSEGIGSWFGMWSHSKDDDYGKETIKMLNYITGFIKENKDAVPTEKQTRLDEILKQLESFKNRQEFTETLGESIDSLVKELYDEIFDIRLGEIPSRVDTKDLELGDTAYWFC